MTKKSRFFAEVDLLWLLLFESTRKRKRAYEKKRKIISTILKRRKEEKRKKEMDNCLGPFLYHSREKKNDSVTIYSLFLSLFLPGKSRKMSVYGALRPKAVPLFITFNVY